MKRLYATVILALLTIGTNDAGATEPVITGERHAASVIDGDTLQIGSAAVQLVGIDAPELGQVCTRTDRAVQCGRQAAQALRKIIDMATLAVICTPLEATAGTSVATCVQGERDISLTLIEGGFAITLPDAPLAYRIAEEWAKFAGIGLWGGTFRAPAEWREENRAISEASRGRGICPFYGHIDGQGRRLYYGPLDPDYQRIIGDTEQSGPIFCSDEEARESGWLYGSSGR